jgi:hypothetical protein
MGIYSKHIVKLSCIACVIACVGDFATMLFLGTYYPGYSQLKNTMSSLGASISPVSNEMSAWWIIAGFFFIFFGIGFKQAFYSKGKLAVFASWLIILYGLGEGIGSGAFKADFIGNSFTTSAILHDTLGAVGVAAILIFPLFMKRIISKTELHYFHTLSMFVFFLGIGLLLLFLFRFSNDKSSFLNKYQGLWQRLMMLNNYIYLTVIAIIMYKKELGTTPKIKKNK